MGREVFETCWSCTSSLGRMRSLLCRVVGGGCAKRSIVLDRWACFFDAPSTEPSMTPHASGLSEPDSVCATVSSMAAGSWNITDPDGTMLLYVLVFWAMGVRPSEFEVEDGAEPPCFVREANPRDRIDLADGKKLEEAPCCVSGEAEYSCRCTAAASAVIPRLSCIS